MIKIWSDVSVARAKEQVADVATLGPPIASTITSVSDQCWWALRDRGFERGGRTSPSRLFADTPVRANTTS